MTRHGSKPGRLFPGPLLVVVSWVCLILAGATLLSLPVSAHRGSVPWIDALFTSTSAVCVTGLSTIQVGTELSPFGQAVLLGLIQVGGLGISTVSTLLLLAAGRATLSHYYQTQQALAAIRTRPTRLLLWAVAVTVAAEAIGAVVLAYQLEGPAPWWSAWFHSVAAFCNAGFSLYADNLTSYRGDAVVVGTVSTLIALGGLGFIALRQLSMWLTALVRRRPFRLHLHTKTVLVGSFLLWCLGALMFGVLERSNTMAGLPWQTRALSAIFQSVTTRTAGFNTLDFGQMREPTLLLTLFLMFIGAAPAGCAGGVKITTFLVIIATVRARQRDDPQTTLLGRTVPQETVSRAFYLVTLAMLFVAAVIVLLLVTEEQPPVPGHRADRLTALAFEAVSAFGTVGLSTGITPALSVPGKLLIILTMFVGRLGPLAVALAVFRPRSRVRFEYPKEELAIG